MNLLLDEHPLVIMPSLATKIGLNESIVLQQVHYWLQNKEKSNQDIHDGYYWVYNTYEQWQAQFPFWSVMTIRRTITKLENNQLLLSAKYNKAGFDKTKWYTINYPKLENILNSPSVQNEHMDCSDRTDGSGQNEQTNTIDYTKITTETSFKVLKGATLKRSTAPAPFNNSILEKQIIKACHKNDITDHSPYVKIIEYYYAAYNKAFNEEHPRLSESAMNTVVSALSSGTDLVQEADFDMYHDMIDKHFQTQYKDCDYNICHFMSDGIRDNRFYETCY